MFFNAEEDEGDFLSPSSGSKLGALFGIDQASSQGGNESLKYSAPKQPRKKGESSNQSSGAAPVVLNAAAVHAYKYTDGQYAKQGKLGAAILGNHANQDYKILIYVSKQQQVTNVKIYSGFTYTVQPNNYASFYDDARQSWSIMFDTEQAATTFAKQVTLARALTGGGEVLSQDLRLGEGGPLESGDSAEVKYTGWLLTNYTFGKVFDSNANADKLFRFKLGKGKVIKGWDIGVLGMKKNGKRLLVVPPHFAYGDSGMGERVPPHSTLIFEIEVVRVKLSKGDSPSESPAPAVTNTAPPGDEIDDQTVKGRTRSITEQLEQSPKSDKAKLISRMAKMGKPMLPMSGAVPATDGEELEQDGNPHQQPSHTTQMSAQPAQANPAPQPVPQAVNQGFSQPVNQPFNQPVSQPFTQQQYQPQYQQQFQPMANNVNSMAAQPVMQQQQPPAFVQNLPSQQQQQHQLSLYQPIQPPVQQPPFQSNPGAYGQQPPNPYNSMYPNSQPAFPNMTGANPSTDVNTPILMSEARQQNTEVRLAVGKVSDRVDKILEKLEHMQVHGTGSSLAVPGNTQPMENGVLLHNIQKVIQENERLKKELFEKSARIESQNEKIGDLLQRNQRYVEQSNILLEQRNDTFKNTAAHSQARVLTLEQEKVQIATELSVATAQISSLQLELSALRKKEGEMKQQLSTVLEDTGRNKDEFNKLRIAHSDEERKVSELSESLKDEKLSRRQLENQVTQLQEELSDVKLTNETLDKNLTERKKKSGEERKKLEEELEELKSQYEEELQSLKNKLRKQKSSTDAATAEQISQLEKEITDEWREKSEKMLKAAEDKHSRALREVEAEKSQAQQNVKDLEKKVQTLKSNNNDSDQKLSSLQAKVEDLEPWKDKYESLRAQASVMKERYESRIQQLEESVEEAGKKAAIAATTTASSGSQQDVTGEVRKIMSSVYHSLRGEFQPEGSYTGSQALALILNTIKSETLKMTSEAKNEESEEEEEEESEDEEDESEDEAERKPVVMETITPKTQSTNQGVSPSKAAHKDQPAASTDDRSMADVEADILSQLVGAGEAGTKDKSASPKKTSERVIEGQVEPVIAASAAKITGDKGNKYYSEELDRSKEKEEIREVVEPKITSSHGAITGDKGNKYYTEELDKGKQPISDKAKDLPKADKVDGGDSDKDKPGVPDLVSRDPPPLDDSIKGDDPLFGDDSTVEDTFGKDFKPKTDTSSQEEKKEVKKDDKKSGDKKLPSKTELLSDDSLKEKPPPLFGDDDDDDLDWLG